MRLLVNAINSNCMKHRRLNECELHSMNSSCPEEYWKCLNSVNKSRVEKSSRAQSFCEHSKNADIPLTENSYVPAIVIGDRSFNLQTQNIDSNDLNKPKTQKEILKHISQTKNSNVCM